MSELISIIVPVYNCEQFLHRCLDSICNQTYSNLQVILVNDGSVDNSESVCKKYIELDSRFELISIKNLGSSGARNIGLKNVKGKYISFIDSDDFVSSDYIELLYNNLINYSADISVCDNIYFENKISIDRCTKNIIEIYESKKGVENILLKIYKNELAFIVPWGKLYKTNLFDGILFPEGKCFDDQATIYKTYLRSSKIVYSKVQAYYYYKNMNSISNTVYLKNPQDFFPIFEERLKLFQKLSFKKAYKQTLIAYFYHLLNFCKNFNDKSKIFKMKQIAKKIIIKNVSIKTKIKLICFLINPNFVIRYFGGK